MFVVGEFANLLDLLGGAAETVESLLNVDALAHRADAQVVLLVDPDQQGLVLVVEYRAPDFPLFVLENGDGR